MHKLGGGEGRGGAGVLLACNNILEASVF